MANNSKIQWTDHTWNIAVGCSKVDEDCKYCYMYRDSARYKYDPKTIRKTKTVFNLPLRIKEPSKIFVSSLTDVFHPAIDSFRDEMWDIIRRCPQHTFQILTKRPERIKQCLPWDWDTDEGYQNVWLGTSVGHQKAISRVFQLLAIPAKVHFVSFEPLWGPVDMNLDLGDLIDIEWAIIGGESGNETGKYRYRPCDLKWIDELITDLTPTTDIFIKQFGTHLSKTLGYKDRHGGDMDEWPIEYQIRNFPRL